MTYYIISTRQRPSALNYSRELPSKATKPSNMAEPLGSSCSRRRHRRRGIGTRTRTHARTHARGASPAPPHTAARARTCCGGVRPRRWVPRRMSSGRGGRAGREPGGPLRPLARTHPALAQGGTLGRAFGLLWRNDCVNQTHFWVTAATGGSTLIPCQNERVGTGGRRERAQSPRRRGLGPSLTLRDPRCRLRLQPQGRVVFSFENLFLHLPCEARKS